jgi:hypothetical protein
VAAGEDQPQSLVGHAGGHGDLFSRLGLGRRERGQLGDAGAEATLAPEPVDRSVARHGDDPRRGIAGDAVVRPARERRRERVLDRVLGDVPVAERSDERRDRASEVLAEQALDGARCNRLAQDAALSPPALSTRAAYWS